MGGAADDAGGSFVGDALPLPVPDACLFTPWWMYSPTPSRLKADDTAKRAQSSSNHEFRNMFVEVDWVCRSGRERKWSQCRAGLVIQATRFTAD